MKSSQIVIQSTQPDPFDLILKSELKQIDHEYKLLNQRISNIKEYQKSITN